MLMDESSTPTDSVTVPAAVAVPLVEVAAEVALEDAVAVPERPSPTVTADSSMATAESVTAMSSLDESFLKASLETSQGIGGAKRQIAHFSDQTRGNKDQWLGHDRSC